MNRNDPLNPAHFNSKHVFYNPSLRLSRLALLAIIISSSHRDRLSFVTLFVHHRRLHNHSPKYVSFLFREVSQIVTTTSKMLPSFQSRSKEDKAKKKEKRNKTIDSYLFWLARFVRPLPNGQPQKTNKIKHRLHRK